MAGLDYRLVLPVVVVRKARERVKATSYVLAISRVQVCGLVLSEFLSCTA